MLPWTVRLLVLLTLSLLLIPLAVAQPVRKVPQIGLLSLRPFGVASPFLEAFRHSLGEMGYAEGQNVAFAFRHAAGRDERLPALAAELVHHNADVIVVGETPAIHAAIEATATITIVMLTVLDPVEEGFVKGLARPGGNVTGVGGLVNELTGKLLELLKDAVPGVTQIAVFVTPEDRVRHGTVVQEAAQALGVQLQWVEVRERHAFESAFSAATGAGAGAGGLPGSVSSTTAPSALPPGRALVPCSYCPRPSFICTQDRSQRSPSSAGCRRFSGAGPLPKRVASWPMGRAWWTTGAVPRCSWGRS